MKLRFSSRLFRFCSSNDDDLSSSFLNSIHTQMLCLEFPFSTPIFTITVRVEFRIWKSPQVGYMIH